MGSAGADPYPPLLPTVPAVGTVPAPQAGGPVAPGEIRVNADSPVIAPGSYPVQARTGVGPASNSPDRSVEITVIAAVACVSAIVAFYAVRRSRHTP